MGYFVAVLMNLHPKFPRFFVSSAALGSVCIRMFWELIEGEILGDAKSPHTTFLLPLPFMFIIILHSFLSPYLLTIPRIPLPYHHTC
jgi:hypothetical protein